MPSKLVASLVALLLLGSLSAAAVKLSSRSGSSFGDKSITVSQRNRQFEPDHMDIALGTTVRIVNDDGELQHHAYIDSPHFSFDSGDQKPGDHSDILFSKLGSYEVLCAIHPKMVLSVSVR